jgi:hypothetical protein
MVTMCEGIQGGVVNGVMQELTVPKLWSHRETAAPAS